MAKTKLRIVIGQANFMVGDMRGNAARMIEAALVAKKTAQADLIVFPELSLTGYPPEDLLLRHGFNARVERSLAEIVRAIKGIDVIVGHPHQDATGLYNAASLIRNGKIIKTYTKQYLPNYSVFDEKRYFSEGDQGCVVSIKNINVAITICEDLWYDAPMQQASAANADLMISINASPFYQDKHIERVQQVQRQAQSGDMPIVYVHCVGGQDELVFDGASMVVDANGKQCVQAPFFEEIDLAVDFEKINNKLEVLTHEISTTPNNDAMLYSALVLGLRDYIEKNGFKGALVGLSGGIDSALTLALVVDAIGAEHVEAVSMPSRYSAKISGLDAKIQAELLNVKFHTIEIEPLFKSLLTSLEPVFTGYAPDVTEENLQARCRGILLMALSNKTGKMVVTTGNKSEMAVGYATLYGDMVGGFAALKDVSKTLVYRLAHYRNSQSPAIPDRVITRPPSAELSHDQVDEDSLPAYSILDPILHRYVELDQSADEITRAGFDRDVVLKVLRLVDISEYKRRQAPPGVKVSKRAFGRDRRYPITCIRVHTPD